MKYLMLITLCIIIFFSQNLIGGTVFADADIDIELTIDVTIDSSVTWIQLKVPHQNDLELNEVRYTDTDVIAQESPKEMNAKVHQVLYDRSDDLVQNHQTIKYNKMDVVLSKQPFAWAFDYPMYLVLGGIVLFATILMWTNEKRIVST